MPEKSLLLLASAGVWATFSELAAVNWISRPFADPQEAAMSLGTEALFRWQDRRFGRHALYFPCCKEPPAHGQKDRPFILGPTERTRLEWRQVKSPERGQQLREKAAWGTPRDAGIAWHVDIAKLKQELKSKKTFIKACEALVKLCGDEETAKSLEEVGKTAFTVLQTRFSNPKFWQAGLELFLALDWHNVSTEVSRWRDAAMEAEELWSCVLKNCSSMLLIAGS
eukprot:g15446.t1